MQLQERGPLSSHESHVSFSVDRGHGTTKHSLYPPAHLSSNTFSLSARRTSPSIAFSRTLHCYRMSNKVPRSSARVSAQASFEIPWLFVYFGDGGVAVVLRGLFIIPLTSWIRAGIITLSMNIHGLRIYERARESDRQKQTEGQSHKHSSTYSHAVKEQITCKHDFRLRWRTNCSCWIRIKGHGVL